MENITLRPQIMYGCKEKDFHIIYSYSAKYFGYFMYINFTKSFESDIKSGKTYFTPSNNV